MDLLTQNGEVAHGISRVCHATGWSRDRIWVKNMLVLDRSQRVLGINGLFENGRELANLFDLLIPSII